MKKLVLASTYSLPFIFVCWFVISFSVNVPINDEWSLVDFFDKIYSHTVSFGDFFAQHNEHRMVFPKIIFAIIAVSSKWNINLEVYFSLFLASVTFWLLYKIAVYDIKRYNQSNQKLSHLFNFSSCIIFFSLIQHENWLRGFQIAWFLINACLVLAVFILNSSQKLQPNYRIVLAAICCFIASFSSAHGLLVWLAVLPLICSIEGQIREKKARLILWILLFIICSFIYSIDYHKPSYHPNTFFIFQHPIVSTKYFLTLLGSAFCKEIFPPIFSGFCLFVSFLVFNIYYFKNYRSDFANGATSWLSLGWFALLFALMTTIGRAGFGVEQALSSRYTSILIYLIISCLQLWRLWLLHRSQDDGKIKKTRFSSLRVKVCLGFLIFLLIISSSRNIEQGRASFIYSSAAQDCLLVINYLQYIGNSPNNCLNYIYPPQDQLILWRFSKILKKLEFRNFDENVAFISKPDQIYGNIDIPPKNEQRLNLRKSESLKLSGWAVFPKQKEQPLTVFISYGDKHIFFTDGIIELTRYDVAKAFNSNQYNQSGWEAYAPMKYVSTGETVIKAWVYQKKNKQFIQLNGETKIKVFN